MTAPQDQSNLPIIGITVSDRYREGNHFHSLHEAYTKAVRLAGGIPLLLPYDAQDSEISILLDRIDGLILSGGGDPSPYFFQQEPVPGVNRISLARDQMEITLVLEAKKRQVPILGICRGMQMVNVALGGDLVQDIPREWKEPINHYPQGIPKDEPYHRVYLEPDSLASTLFQTPWITTNSFHHQALGKMAPGIRITGKTSDGVPEICQSTDDQWYFSGVQFHPEGMYQRYPEYLELFRDLVRACNVQK
jgi:putative glutamine amidotransferase